MNWIKLLMHELGSIYSERNNLYHFSRANQQKAGTKIYSLTQCSLTVNGCDWHILVGIDERINSHCLTRFTQAQKHFTIMVRVADSWESDLGSSLVQLYIFTGRNELWPR